MILFQNIQINKEFKSHLRKKWDLMIFGKNFNVHTVNKLKNKNYQKNKIQLVSKDLKVILNKVS